MGFKTITKLNNPSGPVTYDEHGTRYYRKDLYWAERNEKLKLQKKLEITEKKLKGYKIRFPVLYPDFKKELDELDEQLKAVDGE